MLHPILAFSVLILFSSCAQKPLAVTPPQTETSAAKPEPTAPGPTTPVSKDSKSPAPVGTAPIPVNMTIPPGPTTAAAIVANGPITFDLAGPKPKLPGATLSATITVNAGSGAVPASTTLSGISIKSPTTTGMAIYRPVLVWVTADGKEQQFPIGVNINVKIPKARSAPLANVDTLTFEGVDAGAQIKVRFSALEPLAEALMDGIPNYRECKAPANFKAVADALQPCKPCHEGTFAYDFMIKDLATSCGQNLKLIDKTLSATGTLPAIPPGAHKGVNASPVVAAMGPWKTGEGL